MCGSNKGEQCVALKTSLIYLCVRVCQIASFNRRFYGNCGEDASPEVKGQLRLIHFC